MSKQILVVGASGLVGAAAVEEFLDQGAEVIAVSRRKPELHGSRPFRHLALDLRDRAATAAAMAELPGITHVVYAALYEKPGLVPGWTERDQMTTNLDMLRNVMAPLVPVARGLRHVTTLQGTKAYGVHLHPIPIPAKEAAPRDDHANFYWLQEDYIQQLAAATGFDYTIFRPQIIIGAPYGVAMNLPPVIGAYAAIRRAEGKPFGFPGGPPWVLEAVDARIVAKAIRWAGEAPAAAGQHFNITNGDVFDWRNLWPTLAAALGVEVGPDAPLSVAQFLTEKADVWAEIVRKHGLRPVSLAELVGESHHYADFCFGYGAASVPPPAFVSTIKLRQAGFADCMDTAESFRFWLSDLIARKILPPG